MLLMAIICALTGCKHERAANQVASELRNRMLPSGASATNPTAVSTQGTSISTEWEIRSDLKQDALESWLTETLKSDFTKTSTAEDSIYFAKYQGGESERLEIHFVQETSEMAAAHVRLIIAPD